MKTLNALALTCGCIVLVFSIALGLGFRPVFMTAVVGFMALFILIRFDWSCKL